MTDLVITGIIDGPLTGGLPKAIELFVLNDIADLSIYGIGSANNGGGSDGEEFELSGSASAGDYIYIATEVTGFTSFFGFAPTFTSGAASINGDDAIELFRNGTVVDTFGEINVDGSGQPWEYADGWAYRKAGTTANGSFDIANWNFSEPNALDGQTSNDSASTPVPVRTYTASEPPALLISGIIDGPLSGGVPKAIELFVSKDIADLSAYGIGSANNGGGSDGQELTLSGSASAGDYIYVASDTSGFATFFGFDPDFTGGAASINGDDAIELFFNGVVIDTFGEIDTDGSGQPWEYTDGWAYRNADTGPDGTTFNLGNWTFSGPNELDNESSNESASTPFPLGSFGDDDDGNGGGNGGGPDEVTLISVIQGNSTTQITTSFGREDGSPLEGESVKVQGVVTAVFPELDAFFLQEESRDSDDDSSTSEGIFVFTGSDPTVTEGQLVTVVGAVDEFFGMTQIDDDNGNLSVTIEDAGNNLSLLTPTVINLPATGNIDDFYEQYEGMLVQFEDKLVVSEYFQLARFGQVVLTENERPFQYTHIDDTPTVAEFQAFQEDLARRQVILDDDDNIQNAPLQDDTEDVIYHPQPDGFGTGIQGEDYFRGGDAITDLTGVLHWSFAGQSGTDAWRVRPTEANPIEFEVENSRPAGPEDVGGNIKVSSFNVLNYFTTLDAGSNTVGPNNLDPRGANSTAELERQRTKLVQALAEIDADVFGLVELENDSDDSTLQDIVDALNAEVGPGTYDFIPTGFSGTDAIKVGMIYKPDIVTPTGATAILTERGFTDPNNTNLQRNRPAQAQTFEVTDSDNPDFGESFSVVVNHFKSKGDSGLDDNNDGIPDDPSNPDSAQGDGQGYWNDTRTDAAKYLVNTWIPQLISQGFDEDFLITGDLNAYKGEDPITAIKDAEYTDLIEQFQGDDAYSFVFDSQLGYLDHALSSASLTPQVTGVTEWHINADEVNVFDYNNALQEGNERDFEVKPDGNELFEPNEFRTSDHDPLIIGLNLQSAPDLNPVVGTAERDSLLGTADDDLITGFEGSDTIATDTGNDVIRYLQLQDGTDFITDFAVGSDRIQLTELFEGFGLDSLNLDFSSATSEGYLTIGGSDSVSFFSVDIDGSAGSVGRLIPLAALQGVSATELNDSANFIL